MRARRIPLSCARAVTSDSPARRVMLCSFRVSLWKEPFTASTRVRSGKAGRTARPPARSSCPSMSHSCTYLRRLSPRLIRMSERAKSSCRRGLRRRKRCVLSLGGNCLGMCLLALRPTLAPFRANRFSPLRSSRRPLSEERESRGEGLSGVAGVTRKVSLLSIMLSPSPSSSLR